MIKIDWTVGNKYLVDDIMSQNEAILEGFIINQSTANWENTETYRNHPDSAIWLVLSFTNRQNEKRYVLAQPSLRNNIYETRGEYCNSVIGLYGHEYGDSPEQLVRKLQENRIFTKELCYDAKYKEGYRSK